MIFFSAFHLLLPRKMFLSFTGYDNIIGTLSVNVYSGYEFSAYRPLYNRIWWCHMSYKHYHKHNVLKNLMASARYFSFFNTVIYERHFWSLGFLVSLHLVSYWAQISAEKYLFTPNAKKRWKCTRSGGSVK